MGADDREKALELAFTQIEKQFGKGAIMKLGKAEILKGISVISTGSISLDTALGVGGIPRGRITEIYGPEASGKTSLTLHIIAEAQKAGGVAAFIDAEHALDPKYAQALGVDLDDLTIQADHTSRGADGKWCKAKGKVQPRKRGVHASKHGEEGGNKKAENAKEAEVQAKKKKKTLLQNLHGA